MFAAISHLPPKYVSRALSCMGAPRSSDQAVVLVLLELLGRVGQSHEVTADPEVAKGKAASCAGCRGEIGISETENVPSLPAQPDRFLQLVYFRGVAAMADVTYKLNDQDIAALARDLSRF